VGSVERGDQVRLHRVQRGTAFRDPGLQRISRTRTRRRRSATPCARLGDAQSQCSAAARAVVSRCRASLGHSASVRTRIPRHERIGLKQLERMTTSGFAARDGATPRTRHRSRPASQCAVDRLDFDDVRRTSPRIPPRW
jgi:hypothetical protein